MEIVSVVPDKVTIQFSKDEFRALGNTLNEALNGYGSDLSNTGWTKSAADQLHKDIRTAYADIKNDGIPYEFTPNEIAFLIAMINETVAELDREYSIRMGYTIQEAQQLQAGLANAL